MEIRVTNFPKMDAVLYQQRRRVVNAIREAKAIVEPICGPMSWTKLRLVEYNFTGVFGHARSPNEFCISLDMAKWNDLRLTHTVWHELGHSWFGAEHSEDCPLMAAHYRRRAKKTLVDALTQLASKAKHNGRGPLWL